VEAEDQTARPPGGAPEFRQQPRHERGP
jgi:hypothetical protein